MGIAVRKKAIDLFGGLVTSLDARDIDNHQSPDMCNVDVEDGRARPRYGFNEVRAAQAGFQAVWGAEYLAGFNASYAAVEEYITVENISGTVAAYSRNVSTGAPTAITGATGLHASSWQFVAFDTVAYAINNSNSDPIYKHTLGDTSSWASFKPPTAPTFTLVVDDVKNANLTDTYDQLSFVGVDPSTEMTETGLVDLTGTTTNADGTVSFEISNGSGTSSFRIDLNGSTAGKPDWQYNDIFEFTLTGAPYPRSTFNIDRTSIKIRLTNDSGTDLYGEVTTVDLGGSNINYGVRVAFLNKTRSSFSSIRYLEVEFNVLTSGTTLNEKFLTMSKWWVGCIEWNEIDRVPGTHEFFATYSTGTFESGPGGIRNVSRTITRGYSPIAGLAEMGVWLNFSGMSASANAAVTHTRLYFTNPATGKKHRITEVTDVTTSTLVKMSPSEIFAELEYVVSPYEYANVTSAFEALGTICWLRKGGNQNIAWGRVGEPEKLSSLLDDPEDENQGQTFSMAPGFSDEPVGGLSLGRVQLFFGRSGVYAQQGDRPRDLSAPFRLADSQGCAGPFAFVRWQDDSGTPAAAYLSVNGEIFLVSESSAANPNRSHQLQESTAPIRGYVKSFLLDAQSALSLTDYSTARLWVDHFRDSLWVVMGQRALVLRRRVLSDGNRYWHPYIYNFGSSVVVSYGAHSSKRGMRAMLSNGKLVEFDRNNSTGAFIAGATRDGGSARPSNTTYWESKTFSGVNRRVDHLFLERATMSDPFTISVISTRQTANVSIAANKRFARTSALQQGFDHSFKIVFGEESSAIERFTWDETKIGERFNG